VFEVGDCSGFELTPEARKRRADELAARLDNAETEVSRFASADAVRKADSAAAALYRFERECKAETVERFAGFLAGAPADPGPIAPGLLGWVADDGCAICARCAGRIMARGFAAWFAGWGAIWTPDYFRGCDMPQHKEG
jgi:hypothetical protein